MGGESENYGFFPLENWGSPSLKMVYSLGYILGGDKSPSHQEIPLQSLCGCWQTRSSRGKAILPTQRGLSPHSTVFNEDLGTAE